MTNSNTACRVCLVGAGFISGVHAEALRSLGITISAVVDPSKSARESLAQRFRIANSYVSIEDALAADQFDRAHVLVPPDRHESTALTLLHANKSVLVEKPLATTTASCDRLIAAAGSNATLGVNQNFVYHPALSKVRAALANNLFGRPRFVDVVYHAPLRQLATRQFGHWMFREPRNILLEQAVHPLSQLASLCGDIKTLEATQGPALEISPGVNLFPSFSASFEGTLAPASLRFAVGQPFPFWQVRVVCDDGVLVADILSNRFWRTGRTRWMDAVNDFVSGHEQALSLVRASWKNFLGYALSTAKLSDRSDPFFQSMRTSIGAFHAAADAGTKPMLDGLFGRTMVELCDKIAARVIPRGVASRSPRPFHRRPERCDVAVLGGTGFIGTALVSRLRAADLRVSVLARNLTNLPAIFDDDGVALVGGDIRNLDDVTRAVADATCVINLAHGGGGSNREEICNAMVEGVENAAAVCVANGHLRLIHISSIAALYLGPQSAAVIGATRPDPRADVRADYARAKILCEARLTQMCRENGLLVTVLRPGLVVGSGTSPFHSGLGFFNNEQYCIGWNAGRNPLPFVLVNDVAEAIFLASQHPELAGRSYNLVGDYRPSARAYLEQLGRTLHRPLIFHGKSARGLFLSEFGKWCIKRLSGQSILRPSLHDILSRGLMARFDCSDASTELGWRPVAEQSVFYERAFGDLILP